MSLYTCVNLQGTQYFEMMGNTFECTNSVQLASNGRPTGIYCTDASFSGHSTNNYLDANGCLQYNPGKIQNTFKNLSYGINTTVNDADANSLSYTIHLDDGNFKDCFISAHIYCGQKHVVHSNQFDWVTSRGSSYWQPSAANDYNRFVWMDHANNFHLDNNVITEDKEHTSFIQIDNSWYDISQVSHNSIQNTKSGGFSTSDEYGLRLTEVDGHLYVTCNNFNKHYYGIYIDASSTISSFGDVTTSWHNSFSNINTPGVDIYNGGNSVTYFVCTTCTPPEAVPSLAGNISPNTSPTRENCNDPDDCKKWYLGVKNVDNQNFKVGIYPNPANDQITFDLSYLPFHIQEVKIEITDALGREITGNNFHGTDRQWQLKTINYADGFYFYHILLNGNI